MYRWSVKYINHPLINLTKKFVYYEFYDFKVLIGEINKQVNN